MVLLRHGKTCSNLKVQPMAERQYSARKDDNMTVYKTRKEADEVRKTDPWHRSDERIVKVDGGYVLMSEEDYRVWKNQK